MKQWTLGEMVSPTMRCIDAYVAEQVYEAIKAHTAGAATSAAAALPEGWVPLVITHEGQYPEEVAYGPQILMDRLGKWLRKYFDHVVASKAQPSPTPQADSVLEDAARWRAMRELNWIDSAIAETHGISEGSPETLDAAVDAIRKQGGA